MRQPEARAGAHSEVLHLIRGDTVRQNKLTYTQEELRTARFYSLPPPLHQPLPRAPPSDIRQEGKGHGMRLLSPAGLDDVHSIAEKSCWRSLLEIAVAAESQHASVWDRAQCRRPGQVPSCHTRAVHVPGGESQLPRDAVMWRWRRRAEYQRDDAEVGPQRAEPSEGHARRHREH
ncbi:unnamed protein product [Gadus morhua 'NCC']